MLDAGEDEHAADEESAKRLNGLSRHGDLPSKIYFASLSPRG
jgi:hypothetical protein